MVLLGGLIQYSAAKAYRERHSELLKQQGEVIAQQVELDIQRLLSLGMYLNEFHNYDNKLARLTEQNPEIKQIYIVNRNESILYQSHTLQQANKSSRLSLPADALLVQKSISPAAGTILGKIVVVLNQQLVAQETHRMAQQILLLAAFEILFGVLIFLALLWHQLGRPTRNLLDHIHSVDPNSFRSSPSELSQRHDELGQITRSFDQLIQRLADAKQSLAQHNQLLELRVQERTEALSQSNQALQEDIERRQELELKLKQMAMHDALTGLPNRLYFIDLLERRFDHCKRHQQKLALMLMDLDGFKAINDQYGHQAGDLALKCIASRIQEESRLSDSFSRLGGDEFVMLVENYDGSQSLRQIALKIEQLVQQPISFGRHLLRLGNSIGIAEISATLSTAQALMDAADQAMYRAKSTKQPFRFYVEQHPIDLHPRHKKP